MAEKPKFNGITLLKT